MRRLRWVLGPLILLAPLLVWAPAAQAARAACGADQSTNRTFYGAASTNSTQLFEGFSASMVERAAFTCTSVSGYPNLTAAYGMVYGTVGYAQSGVYFDAGIGCPVLFTQARQNQTVHTQSFFASVCTTNGTRVHVWANYEPSCSCERMWLNSTLELQTAYSPFTEWGFPLKVGMLDEVSYPDGTDIFGTPSLTEDWQVLQYQALSNDVFYGASAGPNPNPYSPYQHWTGTGTSRYTMAKYDTSHIGAWTSTP